MSVRTFNINKRYARYVKSKPIFSYLGPLTHNELNGVLKSIEIIFATNIFSKGVQKKLFNILIEIAQNLCNHLKHADIEGNTAVFLLVKELEGTYSIITGNFLLSDEVAGIKSRIEMLNALDNDELRELYRGILDIGIVSKGGLGLVDLARKSGRKLSYDFEEIDEKFSFFTLEVTFSNDSKRQLSGCK